MELESFTKNNNLFTSKQEGIIENLLLISMISTHRPSQIVCTVTKVYVTCMQTALRVHENLCTVLIPLCKSNLNQLMCPSIFSSQCLVDQLEI